VGLSVTSSCNGNSLREYDVDKGDGEGLLDSRKSVGLFEGLLEVGSLDVGLPEGFEVGLLNVGFSEGDDAVGSSIIIILVVMTLNDCSSSDGTLTQ